MTFYNTIALATIITLLAAIPSSSVALVVIRASTMGIKQGVITSLRQCLTRQFFEYFERFSEHGIFRGITDFGGNNPLIIKDKNCLFTIEWE